jgi:hypothetical protein
MVMGWGVGGGIKEWECFDFGCLVMLSRGPNRLPATLVGCVSNDLHHSSLQSQCRQGS